MIILLAILFRHILAGAHHALYQPQVQFAFAYLFVLAIIMGVR